MKKVKTILGVSLIMGIGFACSDSNSGEKYIDLETGKSIEIVKDESTGLMVRTSDKQPVYIYVDTKNKDTIFGATGKVINGHVIKISENKYVFDGDEKLKIDDDGSLKYKDGDYKVKMDDDGDMKVKNGDTKVKTDGETGETKVKNDD
ncbi:MAG: hypothetical protein KBF82_08670 [Chitinophagaceae bacterium]|nr:hypothetical protein [Chitinophagaceae bacterium]